MILGIPSLVLFGHVPHRSSFADRWHRNGMIVVFFVGIGLCGAYRIHQ